MKKPIVIAFILLGLIISCSEDEELTISISDFERIIDENPNPNQLLGILEATTNKGHIIFSIVEQSPNNAFQINTSTGELTVLNESLFDFETNPTITGTVVAENGNVSETTNVKINLNDVEETTITASDFEVTINENPNTHQVLGTINASTNQGELTFLTIQESVENAFKVNYYSGEITVHNSCLYDFENNSTITGIIKVENGDITENVNVVINLNNIQEFILGSTHIEDTHIKRFRDPEPNFINTDNTNYNESEFFNVMYFEEYPNCAVYKSLINFDFKSIPNNISATKVLLVLHLQGAMYCPYCGPNDNTNTSLIIETINSDWLVDNVTWNNQPTTISNHRIELGLENFSYAGQSGSPKVDCYSFDLTNIFNELINSSNNYKGIMFRLNHDNCSNEFLRFYSSNNSDESKRPKIIVEYD